MPPDLSLRLGSAALAQELFEPICALYAAAFSEPPFAWDEEEPARHRESLLSLMESPSFGIAVAQAGTELVGFVYGVTVAVDTQRWEGFELPLPADVAREWAGRTFAIIDLAVQKAWRGQGVGRRLLETLLASRAEERATLTVEPAATATQDFYRHLGWQHVGRKRTHSTLMPAFDVYVLPLRTQDRP